MTRDEVHKALDDSVAQVLEDCAELDPAKADQLRGHLSTAHMCVDQLLDGAAVALEAATPVTPAAPAEGTPEGT